VRLQQLQLSAIAARCWLSGIQGFNLHPKHLPCVLFREKASGRTCKGNDRQPNTRTFATGRSKNVNKSARGFTGASNSASVPELDQVVCRADRQCCHNTTYQLAYTANTTTMNVSTI